MGDDSDSGEYSANIQHTFNIPTFEGMGQPGGIGITQQDPEPAVVAANNEAKSQSE